MVAQGLSQREMAEKNDCSQSRIKYWLKKHGLKTSHKPGARPPLPHNCKTCGETDPKNFYGHRKGSCKFCDNAETVRRTQAIKRQSVEGFGGKCVMCGYNRCLQALEFHHLDPSKKDPNFQRVGNKSFDSIRAEFEKCKLVCSNCHREIHYL